MRVLVTNDDGIDSEGLRALIDALSGAHEVWTFAPEAERSGVSHALTLASPSAVRRLGQREYSCSGTPADCVILVSLGAIEFHPEVVVSGINRGPNLGTDIVYSGTCAAAREAVLCGLPGIAVSCASSREPFLYRTAASFVARNLESLASAGGGSAFINVNAPSSDDDRRDAVWCLPCERVYRNAIATFEAPDQARYCFLGGDRPGAREGGSSDYAALREGRIAISPILVQPQAPAGFRPGVVFD
jgi:5'-nucleotidase